MQNLTRKIVTQRQGFGSRLEIGCVTKMSVIQTAWEHCQLLLKLLMRKLIAKVSCRRRVYDQVGFLLVRTVRQLLIPTSRLMEVSNVDLDVM
jgi:hypothetical protein